jgi:hypothetical protein
LGVAAAVAVAVAVVVDICDISKRGASAAIQLEMQLFWWNNSYSGGLTAILMEQQLL